MTDPSLQYVDVPQSESLTIEQVTALVVPSFGEEISTPDSLPEIAETDLPLVDMQSEALFSVTAAPELDFMDYLDSMDSLPDFSESNLQFADYLSIGESQLLSELVEPDLESIEAAIPEQSSELVEAALSELPEPVAQFVAFQPMLMSDLEETSPMAVNSFSDLCDMNLIDISANPLELGLLDLSDLDDMTLDQDGLDALDLNDITLDQEPLDSAAKMATSLPTDFDWSENFIDNPYLAILWHIDQHGSIEHFEVAAMLNDKKVAKQFAAKLPEYAEMLPFAIDIVATKTGNKYQKRVLVLATV